jgi:two-component system, OmpR family, phosphate regulon response regulator PhoB
VTGRTVHRMASKPADTSLVDLATNREAASQKALSSLRPLILIVSQDPDLYLMLDHILRADNFRTALTDGSGENFLSGSDTSAIVLDCRADSLFAADAYRQLKDSASTRDAWSIALVGPEAERQHVELLKLGIDESFVRPIAPAKLLLSLRSKTTKARRGDSNPDGRNILAFSDLEMRLDSYRVHCGGKEIRLGPIEFRLLRHLLANPDRVFSRDDLIRAAWPKGVHVTTRTVDVHISRLRSFLTPVGRGKLIRTVRSAGYALEDQTTAPRPG